jgi:AcrR family transcriptional regulator
MRIAHGIPTHSRPAARSAAGTERHRERIIKAASDLLKQHGRDAVSTRTVSAAAGVQAPVIYRLFGGKEGLLDAIAVHGYAAHLAQKKALAPAEDPVDDLRAGWEQNISFALANPSLYALIWG